MSRTNNASTLNYLSRSSDPPITAMPLTIAAWFYSAHATNEQTIGMIFQTGSIEWALEVLSGTPIAITNDDLGYVWASASGTYSINTWNHGAAVFGSATSRFAYLNGNVGTENTTSRSPTGINKMSVGTFGQGAGNPFDGRIAELGIWSVALTANEILMLAKGVSPHRVRPSSLVFYAPLLASESGDASDISGGNRVLTETGTIGVADHAPVAPPFGFSRSRSLAAAGGDVSQFFKRRMG